MNGKKCEWCSQPIKSSSNGGDTYHLQICEVCRRNSIAQGIAFRKSLPPQTGPAGPITRFNMAGQDPPYRKGLKHD